AGAAARAAAGQDVSLPDSALATRRCILDHRPRRTLSSAANDAALAFSAPSDCRRHADWRLAAGLRADCGDVWLRHLSGIDCPRCAGMCGGVAGGDRAAHTIDVE